MAESDPNPFDSIERDLVAPLEGIKDEMVEEVKGSLSVICTEFHRIPGSKEHRHSAPGEHPRFETGRLLESIVGSVELDGHVVVLAADTDVSYAPILEQRMQRPIFEGILEQYESRLLDTAVDVIAGG